GKGEVGEAFMARQRFADEADGARVDGRGFAHAHRVLQPAGAAELAHEGATGGVDVLAPLGVRVAHHARELARGPGIELLRERAMARIEEGPVQVGKVAHRISPLRSSVAAWTRRRDRRARSPW